MALDPEEARRLRERRLEADRPLAAAAHHHGRGDRPLGPHLRVERHSALHPAAPVRGGGARSIPTPALLFGSLLVTLQITFLSLLLAVVGGVGLAVLFTQSKWVEMSFFPFAVILQVTPIVAIFPLINIYVDSQTDQAAAVRLDRRLLPDPVQHHAGPELGRPQPARPLQAQRRDALADAVASAPAGRDALLPRRSEDRRRPCADRRGGGGVRRRKRRPVLGACQPHHRGRATG